MSRFATEKANSQLQQLFNFLGEYGGVIKTNDSDIWWALDLEVIDIDQINSTKAAQIGVYTILNGDVVFDPIFRLLIQMEKEKLQL